MNGLSKNISSKRHPVGKPTCSAIVVIYNVKLLESRAIVSLLAMGRDDLELVVCDNSSVPHGDNAKVANELPVKYVDMKGNMGLPKAYNVAVSEAQGDFVCVFDDDTAIPSDYFDKMIPLASQEPISIVAPVVLSQGRVFSPNEVHWYHRLTPVKDLNHLPDHLSAINSGIMGHREIFEKCGYNEKLFLDCADHEFIREAARSGYPIKVATDVTLDQDYSRVTDDEMASRSRLRIYYRDFRVYSRDSFGHRLFCAISIACTKLRYAVRFKSLDFFKESE